jgi:hypothetical protein
MYTHIHTHLVISNLHTNTKACSLVSNSTLRKHLAQEMPNTSLFPFKSHSVKRVKNVTAISTLDCSVLSYLWCCSSVSSWEGGKMVIVMVNCWVESCCFSDICKTHYTQIPRTLLRCKEMQPSTQVAIAEYSIEIRCSSSLNVSMQTLFWLVPVTPSSSF